MADWRRYFTIKNQGKEKAEILLYGLIGESLYSDGIGQKQFAEELKALGNVKDIELRISSPGGSVIEGLTIYNLLMAHKATKTVYIDSMAGSIASVIAMCGKVYMPENATMFVHDPMGGVLGYAKDMRKYADELDKMKLGIVSAYRSKCNKPDEEIAALMSEETLMTAKEAVEMGFADEVLEPVRMAATYDLDKYKNVLNSFTSAQNLNEGGNKIMKKCPVCSLEFVNDRAACDCEKKTMQNEINTAIDMETKRVSEILAIAADFPFTGLAQEYIKNKRSAADFNNAVLGKIRSGEKPSPISVFSIGDSTKENARPFKSIGEQLVAVAQSAITNRIDKRLMGIQNAIQGSSGTEPASAGFLIQEDFTTALLDKAVATAKIAPLCFHIPISGNSNRLKAPVINETSRATGSRWGGVQVYRVDEGAAGTPKKPKTAMLEMDLEKMMGLAYATDELLADASALGAILSKAFTGEFGWMLDDEIMNGDGVGRCLGIMKAPCLVTIDKETGQTAKTIVAENLWNMFSRMPANLIGSAKWFVNQDVWPQIFSLNQVIGTGGVPLFMGPNGIAGAPMGTLLGLPIIPVEQAKTLGTTGDVVLANFGEYALIEKGGIQSDESIHVEFLTDQKCFRWIVRNNGQPTWKSSVTPANGSASQSPFIALATRA